MNEFEKNGSNNSMNDLNQEVNNTPVNDFNQEVNNTPVNDFNQVINNTPVNDFNQGVNNTPVNDFNQVINNTPVNDLNQGVNNTPVNDFNQGVSNTSINDLNQGVSNTTVDNQNNEVDDDELVRLFVGEKYDKFYNNKFSVPGFFLTSFYLFYRKMYLYGFLCLILTTILSSISVVIGPVISVLVGIFANKIYLAFAKKKVDKIKYNYRQKSPMELKQKVSSSGGTNLLAPILLFLAYILLAVIVVVLTLTLGVGLGIFGVLTGGKPDTYKGTLYFSDNIDVNEYFTYNIPSEFVKEDDIGKSLNYIYNTNPNEIFGNCEVTLSAIANFTDYNVLANKMAEYHRSAINEKNINNINWKQITEDDTEYYITGQDDKLFIVESTIEELANKNVCTTKKDEIINSINLKN